MKCISMSAIVDNNKSLCYYHVRVPKYHESRGSKGYALVSWLDSQHGQSKKTLIVPNISWFLWKKCQNEVFWRGKVILYDEFNSMLE